MAAGRGLGPWAEPQGSVGSWRRGWLWEGEKGAARKVGVPFSGIFIFGTAREPVDSSEPASAAPAVPKREGKVQDSRAGRCRWRLRGRPDATPTSKMPPPHSCVTQSLGIQGPAQFRQALCGWGERLSAGGQISGSSFHLFSESLCDLRPGTCPLWACVFCLFSVFCLFV